MTTLLFLRQPALQAITAQLALGIQTRTHALLERSEQLRALPPLQTVTLAPQPSTVPTME